MRPEDLPMGRADVLLRFLQLIGKDTPKDLDPYLKDLDQKTELRPLVDQIVDRVIAGDESLYEKYAEARREVGSRNPYASEEERQPREFQQALGYFVSRWTDLEAFLRSVTPEEGRFRPAWFHTGAASQHVPETWLTQFDRVRRLRNEVVHGVEATPPAELTEAGRTLEMLLMDLQNSLAIRKHTTQRSRSKSGGRVKKSSG